MKCFSRKCVIFISFNFNKTTNFSFETWSCEPLLMRSVEMTRDMVLNPACWVTFHFLLLSAHFFQD